MQESKQEVTKKTPLLKMAEYQPSVDISVLLKLNLT